MPMTTNSPELSKTEGSFQKAEKGSASLPLPQTPRHLTQGTRCSRRKKKGLEGGSGGLWDHASEAARHRSGVHSRRGVRTNRQSLQSARRNILAPTKAK